MATYKEIQEYVKANFGFTPKTCWIAHSKEVYGLSPKVANNRNDMNKREYPCPAEKQEDIRKAFKHFGML
ncbi:hypothetical protein [Defluviitalea saccharophila]|jgi:hypothetical protein|uniref:RNA methyltransferase n=1 Tax=Defluviitalea saccharophila TaxID=879970 RepID=A0ABZ2Y2K1_9FIRM